MSGSATASGERLVRVVGAARAALEARAGEVDDLNVFPVADGDTGTNMLITAVAVEEAAAATTGLPWPDRCAALARAALMGARGNSGMILSQLVRGAAESLARGGRPRRRRAGAGPAARERRRLRRRAPPRRGDDADRGPPHGRGRRGRRGRRDLEAVLDAALEGGRDGVAETPELLEVLREAGVVDSGALGLVILLEGLGAGLLGREVAPPIDVGRPRVVEAGHAPSRYRYCTSFLVEGAAIDLDALEASLLSLGDSLLVMGDAAQAKVHVHTDTPERAAEAAGPWGEVTALRVDDMRRQEAERAARLRRAAEASAACAAIALVEGDGIRELVEGLGARALPVDAGHGQIAAALDASGAAEAVVVAASPRRWRRRGRPSAAVPARRRGGRVAAGRPGLSRRPRPRGHGRRERRRDRRARAGVRAADVDGVGAAALRPRLEAALASLLDGEPALVTLLIGADARVSPPEVEAWVRGVAGPEVEVEAHEGGQRRPALAVGVE